MNLFLTILKFAGIIVSGALGILGTVTVTRDKNTGRLTHWGKWALGLTIAGFITALGSQIAQQVKEQHDIRQSQVRIEQQVTLAKTTLNRVQRILTRFDTLSFSVRYELPTNNIFFGALRTFIDNRTLPKIPMPAPHTQSTTTIAYGENIVGYYKEKSKVIAVNIHLKNNSAVIMLPSIKVLMGYFHTNSLSTQEIKRCFTFLNNPHLALAIYAPNRVFSDTPDLYLTTTNLNEAPVLGYDFQSKKYFIEWIFDCPNSNWKQTKRMKSLPDLANSQFYNSLINIPSTISGGLRPMNGEIVVDTTAIPIDNFSKFRKPLSPPFALNFVKISEKIGELSVLRDNPKGLSEDGEYQISWGNLYTTQFPDEEEILKLQ